MYSYSNSSASLTSNFELSVFIHLYFTNNGIWFYVPVNFSVLAILAFKTNFLAVRLSLMFIFCGALPYFLPNLYLSFNLVQIHVFSEGTETFAFKNVKRGCN
jgi:hypothetical protein